MLTVIPSRTMNQVISQQQLKLKQKIYKYIFRCFCLQNERSLFQDSAAILQCLRLSIIKAGQRNRACNSYVERIDFVFGEVFQFHLDFGFLFRVDKWDVHELGEIDVVLLGLCLLLRSFGFGQVRFVDFHFLLYFFLWLFFSFRSSQFVGQEVVDLVVRQL
ncbi:Hypothetical_protein [Hexamita inflata]|uniref:Hypothetical_protein n=1 Tax=Hexamita inflata TaxID=28002 RepID=A0AA86PNK3_9EUKA|nr:Hypothetical protein HINF_LOCUS31130 [Hexamita inflata]